MFRPNPNIKKIYEVDPLTCPKCQGSMKIIAFIEQAEIIEKILKHLRLWLARLPELTLVSARERSQGLPR
jgi:hypothetical protein